MALTYIQLQKQIEQLQRKAETLRSQEVAGVIERIKVAITHYGLTAADLGLETRAIGGSSRRAASGGASGSRIAFADSNGNSWSGRGPRPRWLREALATGRSIDEFRSAAVAEAGASTATRAAGARGSGKATRAKRAPSKFLYRDDAGHSWTGRGPKPGWLKAALDNGKTLQDFLQ